MPISGNEKGKRNAVSHGNNLYMVKDNKGTDILLIYFSFKLSRRAVQINEAPPDPLHYSNSGKLGFVYATCLDAQFSSL